MLTEENKKELMKNMADAKKCVGFIESFYDYEITVEGVMFFQLSIDKLSFLLQLILQSFRRKRILTDEEKSFLRPVYYLDKRTLFQHKEYLKAKYLEDKLIPEVPGELVELYKRCENLLEGSDQY